MNSCTHKNWFHSFTFHFLWALNDFSSSCSSFWIFWASLWVQCFAMKESCASPDNPNKHFALQWYWYFALYLLNMLSQKWCKNRTSSYSILFPQPLHVTLMPLFCFGCSDQPFMSRFSFSELLGFLVLLRLDIYSWLGLLLLSFFLVWC